MDGRTPNRDWNQEAEVIARLPGKEQLEGFLEFASRLEQRGDVEGSIDILKRGINASSQQGRLQYSLQFFGHLRRLYVRDAERGHLKKDVLWYYKWIANAVIQYAEIPLTTVEAMLDDMEQFYTAENTSLRPVWKIRCVAGMYMGIKEAEDRWFAQWDEAPITDADDCKACEWGFQAERFIVQKRDEEALEISKPITSPRNWCSATPEIASLLMHSGLRCKKPRLAQWLSKVSAPRVRKRDSLLDALGYHIVYHGMVGNLDRSRRLAIVGLHKVGESRNDRKNAIFFRLLASWAALVTLRTRGKMMLPSQLFGKEAGAAPLPISDVVTASLQQAQTYAVALDTRNGTSLYQDKVNQFEDGVRKMFSRPSRD